MTQQQEIINDENYMSIFDHGFIGLVDSMGDIKSIARAARTSYGKGTKTINDDISLVDYLIRHRHCYHPEMEVLTIEGWKKWKNCNYIETFLVPDTNSKKLLREKLVVKQFNNEEPMYTFENARLSYCVTNDHTMWFKGKYQDNFKKVKIQNMSKWGHFETGTNYSLDYDISNLDYTSILMGFFLGDGHLTKSKNQITFHLKKERKISFLMDILKKLNISFNRYDNVSQNSYNFTIDNILLLKSGDKNELSKRIVLEEYTNTQLYSLWLGLVNSDGSIKQDRPQIEYSSKDIYLAKLFETLSSMFEYDCHKVSESENLYNYKAYYNYFTIESRKQFHNIQEYHGKVYCATSSTGMLLVRGAEDTFSIVCGNTSPLEMVEFVFHIKMPIFVARQWIRHRTASLNEYSARYSEMTDEFYVPENNHINPQSTSNNQGREEGSASDNQKDYFSDIMKLSNNNSYASYKKLLDSNQVAREIARTVLPVSNYTEMYWKIDLHNLFHFLKLRMDSHAQYEIRVYANAIYDLVEKEHPKLIEMFDNYILNSVTFSNTEMEFLREILNRVDKEYFSNIKSIIVGSLGERKSKEFFTKIE